MKRHSKWNHKIFDQNIQNLYMTELPLFTSAHIRKDYNEFSWNFGPNFEVSQLPDNFISHTKHHSREPYEQHTKMRYKNALLNRNILFVCVFQKSIKLIYRFNELINRSF